MIVIVRPYDNYMEIIKDEQLGKYKNKPFLRNHLILNKIMDNRLLDLEYSIENANDFSIIEKCSEKLIDLKIMNIDYHNFLKLAYSDWIYNGKDSDYISPINDGFTGIHFCRNRDNKNLKKLPI